MSRTSFQELATHLILIALIMMSVSPALAVDVEWNGSTNNDYNTATNWQDGFVPGVNDQARIGTSDGGVGAGGLTNHTVNLNDGSASFLSNFEHNRNDGANNNVLNITGAGTSLNVNSTTRLNQSGGAIGTGTFNMDGAQFRTNIGGGGNLEIARGGGTASNHIIDLNNGSIFTVFNSVLVGQGNNTFGRATFNLDATSQMRIDDNLELHGGVNGGQATYTLPLSALSDSPISGTGGTINLQRDLRIGVSNNANIAVTVDSNSASVSNFTGNLDLGHGTNANGELTINDGRVLNFRRDENRWTTANGGTASVTLNNASQLRLGDNLRIGQDGTGGVLTLNINDTSRLEADNQLEIGGGNNAGGQQVYNFPLAGRTPTDGKMSVAGRFAIASRTNTDTALTVDNAGGSLSSQFYAGEIDIAQGSGSNGALTVNDGIRMNFARDNSEWASGANNPTATVTLNGGSIVRIGDSLQIGQNNDDRGTATITVNGTSQLNVDGELMIRGGLNDGQASYNLPLAGRTPTDGAISVGQRLAIATSNNSKIALTVDNAGGSAANQFYAGELDIATNTASAGVVTINDGIHMNFSRDDADWATGTNNPTATVTLNGGSQLRLGQSLRIGQDGDDRGTATINVNGTSRLHIDDDLILRGGLNDGQASYNLPLAGSTPTDGKISVGNTVNVGGGTNADIALTVDNAGGSLANQTYLGDIDIATGSASNGSLTINDGIRMNFSSDNAEWASGANNSTATVTLNGGSQLRLGNSLNIGQNNDDRGTATININGTSRLHVDNELLLRGGLNDGQASYNLPLAGNTPTDGGLSVGTNMRIAASNNSDIALTVDTASGSAANQYYTGRLDLAPNSAADADLTVSDGIRMNFSRDDSNWATGNNNTTANVTLNGGSIVRLGQTLRIGQDGDDRGVATLALNGGSQIQVDNELEIRGGNSDGTATYNFGLSSSLDPQAGTVSFGSGNLRIASRNQADIDLTINGTGHPTNPSAANVDPRNDLMLAQDGSNNDGTLTLNTNMNFGGRGRLAGNNNNHARLTMNGVELGFNGGQTEIRNNNNASAEIDGTGTFDGGDTFRSNGAFIADGGNLNIDYGSISDNNLAVGQAGGARQAGWYAQNDGTLVLRELRNISGDVSLGENSVDSSLDLVNSARVTDWNTAGVGSLGLGVIDPTHTSVSGLTNPVGVFEFTGSATAATADVQFRYDDAAAVTEGNLKVFQLQGGTWVDVTNGGALDTGNNRITAQDVPSGASGIFAVAEAGAAGGSPTVTGFVGNRPGVETVSGGNENWNVDGTWNNDQPEGRDTVRIRGGHAVTLDSGAREKAQDVRLSDGGSQTGNSLTIESGSHLRVWDSLDIARASDSDATLTLNDTSTLQIDDNLQIGGAEGTPDGVAGTINVNGTSSIRTYGDLTIGNSNADDASAFNIAAGAQIHIGGNLNLRGEDAAAGTTPVYTLPIAGVQGGAGFLAIDEDINLQNENDGAVVLNVNSTLGAGLAGAARSEFDGNLRLARNDRTEATLNLTSVDWHFARSIEMGGRSSDGGTNGDGTLNLVDSHITARDALTLGNRFSENPSTITLDANSSIQAGQLGVRAEDGQGVAYTLPVTGSTQKDGFISIRNDINVQNEDDGDVTLNLNSTLAPGQAADSVIQLDGSLRVARSSRTEGTLNLTGVRMELGDNIEVGATSTNGGDDGDGTLNLVNSQIIARDSLTIGNNANENASTFTLDATSQIQASQLNLQAEDGAGVTHTLPLTGSEAKNSFISIRNDINIQNADDGDVTLNLNSTLPVGQAADTTIELDGTLRVARNNRTEGTLNMTGVQMDLGRGIELGGRSTDGGDDGDATVNLVNSHIFARDALTIGNNGNENASSITLDADSSMQAVSLNLRAEDGQGVAYTLPLTGSTRKDGFISIRNDINVQNDNEGDVELNLNSTLGVGQAADSVIELDGSLRIARNDRTEGTLNMTGVRMEVARNIELGGRSVDGGDDGDATLNLVNSQIIARDNLTIGNTVNENASTITLDATSQMQAGNLNLQAEKNLGTPVAYNLPLTGSTLQDGKISIRNNINVSNANNSDIHLTLDTATGASPEIIIDNNLNVATNNGSLATVNLNGVTINAGGSANIATPNNNEVRATINMTGGGIVVRDNMNIRTGNDDAAVTIQGSGVISTSEQLTMNGRMIADGGTIDVNYERDRLVQSRTSLMGDGNRAGWYAQNQGRINLPSLLNVQGDVAWADTRTDVTPDVNDLINSVVFNFTNLAGPVNLDGSLLADDHPSVPAGLISPIGVWLFDASPTDTTFDDLLLTIRYDDALTSQLGLVESDLKFLRFSDSMWEDITLSVDTVNKLITLNPTFIGDFTDLGFFALAEDFNNDTGGGPGAVLIPEPSTLILAALGLLGMAWLGRRRRQR